MYAGRSNRHHQRVVLSVDSAARTGSTATAAWLRPRRATGRFVSPESRRRHGNLLVAHVHAEVRDQRALDVPHGLLRRHIRRRQDVNLFNSAADARDDPRRDDSRKRRQELFGALNGKDATRDERRLRRGSGVVGRQRHSELQRGRQFVREHDDARLRRVTVGVDWQVGCGQYARLSSLAQLSAPGPTSRLNATLLDAAVSHVACSTPSCKTSATRSAACDRSPASPPRSSSLSPWASARTRRCSGSSTGCCSGRRR